MIFKAVNILMVVLFSLAASVQCNDPDPIVWISLYVSAAVLSIAHSLGKLPSFWPLAFALLALLWAYPLVPLFWGQAPLAEVFGHAEMKTEAVEVAREFGGLMIVAACMAVLGFHKMTGRLARGSLPEYQANADLGRDPREKVT